MTDVIIILVLAAVLGMAGLYVYRARKGGRKCIGCPYAKQCASRGGGCACRDENE